MNPASRLIFFWYIGQFKLVSVKKTGSKSLTLQREWCWHSQSVTPKSVLEWLPTVTATVEFFLNAHNDTDAYLAAIDQIQWRDQATNTSGGIRMMHSVMFKEANGDRPGIPSIGIVVTDGASSTDSDLTIPEADIARHKGIRRVI